MPELDAVASPVHLLTLLAAVSGLAFSLIGIAYRFAQSRSVVFVHVGLSLSTAGFLYFGLQSVSVDWGAVPMRFYLVSIAVGLSQYVAFRTFKVVLQLGPLSPMWCATNMSFLVVIAYSAVFLGESINAWEAAGIAAGIACIYAGSLQQREPQPGGLPQSARGVVLYLLLLVALFLLNSLIGIGAKTIAAWPGASAGANAMEDFGPIFFALVYAGLGAPMLIQSLREPRSAARLPTIILAGAMAAAGSLIGMILMRYCVQRGLESTRLFMPQNIFAILPAAVISVVFFRERPSRAWWSMMILGLVAIVLVAFGKEA